MSRIPGSAQGDRNADECSNASAVLHGFDALFAGRRICITLAQRAASKRTAVIRRSGGRDRRWRLGAAPRMRMPLNPVPAKMLRWRRRNPSTFNRDLNMTPIAARLILAVALLFPAVLTSKAQTYPTRAITVIIPFAGGSASDVVSRIMLDK